MTCSLCGSSNLIQKEDITLSSGKTYKIFKCRDCGMIIKIPY